jgi:hypothetical protein
MINRRRFLALLPVVPQVCKARVVHNAEWDQFASELSRALSNLDNGRVLIIETKPDVYYVQFAGRGLSGMRAESVSNGYLKGPRKLSDKACMKLLQLGWNAPTIIPDAMNDVRGYKRLGSPNYFLDFNIPVPYRSIANLAVSTLREVFGAMHPGELRYRAFAKHGGEIGFPNLRIAQVTSDRSIKPQRAGGPRAALPGVGGVDAGRLRAPTGRAGWRLEGILRGIE